MFSLEIVLVFLSLSPAIILILGRLGRNSASPRHASDAELRVREAASRHADLRAAQPRKDIEVSARGCGIVIRRSGRDPVTH
ncbi:hypothetical protein [Brevirhabdus sp.]|uniref:hypothetical protein n=1 Tax=Brevirhabdus sp. TaxID=2004514 RepID=UPI004058FB54